MTLDLTELAKQVPLPDKQQAEMARTRLAALAKPTSALGRL
jgi:hypothetical protein